MLSDASADLVYRIGLWCLLRGNPDRAQAHLRQLREDNRDVLANKLAKRMIERGITPTTKRRPLRQEITP